MFDYTSLGLPADLAAELPADPFAFLHVDDDLNRCLQELAAVTTPIRKKAEELENRADSLRKTPIQARVVADQAAILRGFLAQMEAVYAEHNEKVKQNLANNSGALFDDIKQQQAAIDESIFAHLQQVEQLARERAGLMWREVYLSGQLELVLKQPLARRLMTPWGTRSMASTENELTGDLLRGYASRFAAWAGSGRVPTQDEFLHARL